jgi:hypothetical protein
LFGGAALAGAAIGPDRDEDVASREPDEHFEMTSTSESKPNTHAETDAPHPVRGLAVAEDSLLAAASPADGGHVMPRIQPIDAARATGRARELADEFASRGGEPGPMVLAMANAPALLQGYLDLNRP